MSGAGLRDRYVVDLLTQTGKVRISGYLSMFVSCDCCDKLSQTWWVESTKMYSLTVLETRSPKSRLGAKLWKDVEILFWGSIFNPLQFTNCNQKSLLSHRQNAFTHPNISKSLDSHYQLSG